jgi:hypothetical protein
LLRFTPPPNAARYAVARGKHFKTYDAIASAKRAVHGLYWYGNSSNPTYILERVRDAWFVLYEVLSPKHPPWRKVVPAHTIYGYGEKHDVGEHYVAVPMSADDYAAWRLEVEKELSIGSVQTTFSSGSINYGTEK